LLSFRWNWIRVGFVKKDEKHASPSTIYPACIHPKTPHLTPAGRENGVVVIAMANTTNTDLLNELKFIFNKDIIAEKWPEEKLLEAICQAYQLSGEEISGKENSQGFEYLLGMLFGCRREGNIFS